MLNKWIGELNKRKRKYVINVQFAKYNFVPFIGQQELIVQFLRPTFFFP